MIITEKRLDISYCENMLTNNLGIKFHIIKIDNKTLIKGMSTDPLYQLMLSKCVAKNRFIYKTKNKIASWYRIKR